MVPNNLLGILHTDLVGVEVLKPLIGVQSDDNISKSRIWFSIVVSLFQVVKNRGLTKKRMNLNSSERRCKVPISRGLESRHQSVFSQDNL